ncbi:hypothetical protein ESY86_17850 [Subsaximicrobium wynnwilliamsii]|uniref:DUF4878 domain-containing protein n=1 Tax=Subsaximicrobium wynnwilliamsii TaxID=291179 RepID=A0A5C6ZC19_9FLAO|nr:hypothetical protein [Subsaximicrobium wynnwilliamsii]TXD81512.1 hypothetical protein ESY87_17850 [Subsaximicrobium wynnwilliamsii]TXD87178.1 hypothetical protein ESY86_17850 [Subsaximicrobium wynnwilliamsii]TXE00872.1 hypothetical protein ESY88_18100 [Subsaximicrobium wynnwilliamsii]
MKNLLVLAFIMMLLSCSEANDTAPAKVAEIVAESFYQGNDVALKEHTTAEGYANFSNLQKMFAKPKSSKTNFKLIDQDIKDDVAWVKYSTAYDKTPGVFKLVKLDGRWKVTVRTPREQAPF